MLQAGVIVSDYATLMVEILKDNARVRRFPAKDSTYFGAGVVARIGALVARDRRRRARRARRAGRLRPRWLGGNQPNGISSVG
jgi:hypothetical protein